jgi:hypothetical protein
MRIATRQRSQIRIAPHKHLAKTVDIRLVSKVYPVFIKGNNVSPKIVNHFFRPIKFRIAPHLILKSIHILIDQASDPVRFSARRIAMHEQYVISDIHNGCRLLASQSFLLPIHTFRGTIMLFPRPALPTSRPLLKDRQHPVVCWALNLSIVIYSRRVTKSINKMCIAA